MLPRLASNFLLAVVGVSAILSLGSLGMPTLENTSSFTFANDLYSFRLGENKSQKDLQAPLILALPEFPRL